jgi:hypothetical protein
MMVVGESSPLWPAVLRCGHVCRGEDPISSMLEHSPAQAPLLRHLVRSHGCGLVPWWMYLEPPARKPCPSSSSAPVSLSRAATGQKSQAPTKKSAGYSPRPQGPRNRPNPTLSSLIFGACHRPSYLLPSFPSPSWAGLGAAIPGLFAGPRAGRLWPSPLPVSPPLFLQA